MILFLVFLFAYTLSQFYRSFLAVIAPGLSVELGLTPSDLANMSAIWFGVFAFAQFPLGYWLDRFGPRRTVPLIMTGGVIGALVFARAQGVWGCHAAMALIGLGCSPIYMGALFHFGRTQPPERFGFLSACLLGFGSAGNLLAATPLALAVEAFGWRTTFVGLAAVMLLSAALFHLVVRDPPPAVRPAAASGGLASVIEIIKLPGLWTLMPLLTLGYACVVVERGLWVGPYFASVHELKTVAVGNAVLAMAVTMSLGALAFGALDRRFGRRKIFVVTGTGLAALGFLYFGLVSRPSLGVAVALMAFVGFVGLCHPLLFTHARMFYPEHLLGRGITFANFLTIGGAGLVHFMSGAYVDRMIGQGASQPEAYAALHLAFAVTMLIALAIYTLSPADPRRRT